MDIFKVFISSTRVDLANFRKEVSAKLTSLQQIPIVMEHFGAYPAGAVLVSSDKVRDSDIFIGIYAYRYGYVPEGSECSITEMEYNLARSLGKRCLCYVAAESLRPEIITEDSGKQERLTAFKQRIDRELVRETFISPEDLREKVGDDIGKLLRGEPIGYAHKDVKDRWLKWEGLVREHTFNEELNNPPISVDSPLESHYAGFIETLGWHEKLAEPINEVRVRIERFLRDSSEFPILSDISQTISKMNLDEDYLILLNTIRGLTSNRVMDSIEQIITRLNKEKSNRLDSIYEIRNWLRELRKEHENRYFNKVFCVIGGLGAGKTHFMASLLAEGHINDLNYDYLLLPLDRSQFIESVESMILRRIREATRMQWRSVEEFDAFLDYRNPLPGSDQSEKRIKLVIVLDDFQKGLFKLGTFKDDKDGLINFISHNTKLHSLHWLILLQDTFYLEVAEKKQSWFWQEYSYVSPAAEGQEKLGQWLSLDELNRSERTGLELIRETLGAVTEEDRLALDRIHEDQYILNNLSNPFIAGVLLDLREQIPLKSLVDLNYIAFVTRFWEKRLFNLDTGSLGTALLELSVGLTARSLLKSESSPTLTGLLDDITDAAARAKAELKNRDKAEMALRILENANLLKIESIPDPDLGDYPIQRITIRFETFWEWNIARQLRVTQNLKKADIETTREELEKWFSGDRAQEIKSGVFTFLLLLLDQDAKQDKITPDFIERLLRLGLSSKDLLVIGAWFAGPKASLPLQKALASLAKQDVCHYDEPRALFGFLYFLAECLLEALDEPSRLKLLQPHFERIDQASLSDYYKYIAERLFGNAEDEIILSCMPYFSGCEVLDITEELAEITLYNTEEGYDPEEGPKERLDFVIKYLKANFEFIRNEFKRRWKPQKGARYFYWEWFLCEFCRYVVYEMDLDAYDFLAKNNWYESEHLQLYYPVSLRMRQEANLALGYWYRTHGSRDRQRYRDLVSRLADSPDPRQRETAFFLIRHTRSYDMKQALPLDKVFRPVLKKIFLDPEMNKIVSSYYVTFKINLDDFKALEHQRRRASA